MRYDAEAALYWLKSKIRQEAVRVYDGSYDVVYHHLDESKKTIDAYFCLGHLIISSETEGGAILKWSSISVDKQDLEGALAAETTRSDKSVEAQAAEEEENNERNAGRKTHKSFGPVMAMAGAWLEYRDYSAGDEDTEALMTELRKAMTDFAQQHLQYWPHHLDGDAMLSMCLNCGDIHDLRGLGHKLHEL